MVWKKISNFVSPIWCWACVKSPKTIAPWRSDMPLACFSRDDTLAIALETCQRHVPTFWRDFFDTLSMKRESGANPEQTELL